MQEVRSTYSSLILFTWRVIAENHCRVMGVGIGDQDTRTVRAVDGVGASGLVGSEHAGNPCCRQQRPGELCVHPPVEPANLDHVRARFGWVLGVSDVASRSGGSVAPANTLVQHPGVGGKPPPLISAVLLDPCSGS